MATENDYVERRIKSATARTIPQETRVNTEAQAEYAILSRKAEEQNSAIEEWQARAKTASTKAAEAIKKAKAMGGVGRWKATPRSGA